MKKEKPPAGRGLQDEYDVRRTALCAALARNWEEIREWFLEVDVKAEELEDLLKRHPEKSFKLFRPEDCRASQEAGEPVLLR